MRRRPQSFPNVVYWPHGNNFCVHRILQLMASDTTTIAIMTADMMMSSMRGWMLRE